MNDSSGLPSKQSPPAEPALKSAAPHSPTEFQLAAIFAENHRDQFRYVAAWGKWFEWRGGCWRAEKTLRAFDLIRQTCERQGLKRSQERAATVAGVHTLARADHRLAATVEQWDADPWLINTPDGVIDLKTGERRRCRPEDYMTMITAVGPRGDCPRWKAFLKQITNGDEALAGYLQRVAGYCLTGDTSEQCLFFAYGPGNNGKGVFLRTISGILGDYAQAAAIETFTESRSDRHPTELAELHSVRLVTASETESGKHWVESRIKMLTGGDPVRAHFMRQDNFEYIPKFKLNFSGNHKPGLRSVGEAMRRRVNMIPFTVIIPPEQRDPQLETKLKPEWPGVLQWMIDGCLDWQERGLAPPSAVMRATDAYFAAQDNFTRWLDDCCDLDPNKWESVRDLFGSWKAWAEKAGVRFGTVVDFGETLDNNASFRWQRMERANGYWGARLRGEKPPQYWTDHES